MSEDNLEVVRQGYEMLNRGNLDALLELFDPEIEVRTAVDVPGFDLDDVYFGPEGFLKFFGQMGTVWEDARWEPEDYLDAGDDVVVYIRFTGRGKGSGVPVAQEIAHVCTMRDEKLVKHVTFWDRQKALEAAGLKRSQ